MKKCMKDIKEIRSEIDAIDRELVNLFRRRLEISAEVAASKHERGAPVTDPERERAILARVTSEVGEEDAFGARLLFSTLFDISKARQRILLYGESELSKRIRQAAEGRSRFPARARVAVPGASDSPAARAAALLFAFPTVDARGDENGALDALAKGECDYAVVKVDGDSVFDLLERRRVYIVRALGLKELLPGDEQSGTKRFVCVAREPEIYPEARKITVMLTLPHRPGALHRVVAKVASIGVNITWMTSRKVPGTDFEFRFVFDFEASPLDPAVLALFSEMSQDTEIARFAFLGAYHER